MTVADAERFIFKSKLITYIKVFVELYNCKNIRHIYKIYGMIELENIGKLFLVDQGTLGGSDPPIP